MSKLKILPITDDKNKNDKNRKKIETIPEPPFINLIVGPVKTGKSCLLNNLILGDNFYGLDYFDEVYIFSPTIYNDSSSRFLQKYCICNDEYNDDKLEKILEKQKSYEKKDRPRILLVFDDILGCIKRGSKINTLCSRYRHYGIDGIIFSCQNYKGIDSKIRQNLTHLNILSPYPNKTELMKIADELGDIYGGKEAFLKLYQEATGGERYKFLYCKLMENPPQAFENFDKQIF